MRESRHAAFQLIQQSAKQKTISVRRGCMSADVSAANRLNLLAFGPVDQPIEHGGGEIDRVDRRELATATPPGVRTAPTAGAPGMIGTLAVANAGLA